MDCSVPTSDIIPAVAARLKYYLDVERKEAGFDLSVNLKDSNKKYLLYLTPALHQTQRPKKTFLENKIKASLPSCGGKSGAEWTQIVQINQERKHQVQRKIRKKMSSLSISDRFSSNCVHLRSMNWKCSDLGNYSSGLSHSSLPHISHGELRRLVTSAADLIVATTPSSPIQRCHRGRMGQSHSSLCVNIPTSGQDHSSNTDASSLGDTSSHAGCDGSLDAGFENNQTVLATSEKIGYDIAINTGASSPKAAKPSLCMRLVGESGRSKTLLLQTSLVNTTRSCAGQAATCHVKTRDVGELKHVMIGVDRKQKDEDDGQTNKKQSTPSIADAELHGCRNTSPITSMGLQISSCKPVETATKANPDKVSKTNVNKSVASHRRAESKESQKTVIRKRASAERQPQKVYRCEMGAPTVSPGNTDGTSKNVSDQVIMVVEPPSKTIAADGSIQQSPIGEKDLDNGVTATAISTVGNLLVQNNLQAEALTAPNYGNAGSPASYAVVSHESKESPVIDEVNGHAWKNTSFALINGDTKETIRASSDGMNQDSQYLPSDGTKDGIDDRASQLLLLQVLSQSVDNVPASSPRADSQPCSNCWNNAEATDFHRAKADEDIEVHTQSHGYTGSCFQLDSDAAQTSGYCCSCGDGCSYVSDSTLDEDYLFYDTSLSLSEDEDSETPLKSGRLVTGTEDNNEEYNMRKGAKKDIYREGRVDSYSEIVNMFKSSLAAIRSNDRIKLRNLCQSHVFIPSFRDEEGKTLLHHAATQEDPVICQVILDTNVGKVNIDHEDMFGKTALHYAIQNGNTKTMKLLLDNGAKQEIPDEDSKTVSDIALPKMQSE
ncbi:uncharacterized protein LOC134945238 isoform X2 [Pseudophryne corroboree]|uniref:uncharacterized protein LOC134945238 isoform X2 n=1 Tax=Pseudophryne corroboree TaxID=495146 RepID=UPI003081779D